MRGGPLNTSVPTLCPVMEAMGCYLIHSYISRAWHRDRHTADAQEMFAALRGVDMQERGENSAFWIDLQTATVSCSHTHTPAYHAILLNGDPPTSRVPLGGVLSLLIKTQDRWPPPYSFLSLQVISED